MKPYEQEIIKQQQLAVNHYLMGRYEQMREALKEQKKYEEKQKEEEKLQK